MNNKNQIPQQLLEIIILAIEEKWRGNITKIMFQVKMKTK